MDLLRGLKVKLGLYWLICVAIMALVLIFSQASSNVSLNSEGRVNQQLNLLTDLLQKDILLAQKQLELFQPQVGGSTTSGEQSALGPLKLLGIAIREASSMKVYSGYIPLLHRYPQQLNSFNWLCLPDCHLVLKAQTEGREVIAMVDLDERLTHYSKLFNLDEHATGFTISPNGASPSSSATSAPLEPNWQGQLEFANAPIIPSLPLVVAASIGEQSLSMTKKAGAIGLWGVVLLLQIGAFGAYWLQRRKSSYFHRVLSDAAELILQGQSEKVHQLLGVASGVTSHSGRTLLRRFAMLGLREEAARAVLSKAHDEQKWLEQHDKLTELSSRQHFRNQLDRMLAKGGQLAFLLINVDDFKEINDASGQQVGNDMLLKVARLLKRQLQSTDLVGRMSGDEFAVVIRVSDLSEGEALAQRIIEASHHVMLSGRSMLHRLSLSIGIVIAPEHGKDFDTLMTRADVALSYSKKQGKGRFASLKDPELEGHLLKQRFMYSRVHSAIRDRRLALACQPIVDMKTGILSHSEILLRVQDEIGNYVSAYPLIQAAERHRDVGVLDKWVLNQVLNYLMQCRREGRNVRLAVNISGVSISDPQITEAILQRIEFSGCGQNLIIEITESAALENIQRIQKDIERLQQLGCRVALDDFGIGYSSVNNLLNLPFDYVKVDGCFVRKLKEDRAIGPLLEFLVSISSLREFQLIAEFVETPEVAGQLQMLGVQLAQGFYYGEPVLLLKGAAENPTLLPADGSSETIIPSVNL